MRNKLVFLAIIFLLPVTCLFFHHLDGSYQMVRVHQHLTGEAMQDIHIDTKGQTIPGMPHYHVTADGTIEWESYIHGENNENVTGALRYTSKGTEYETPVNLHVRGNSSRYFVKKSYMLHLTDQAGADVNIPLEGMGACNEWALYGPYLDRTLIRNYLCMNIAGEVMDYAPNVRFVNLYMDGEFQGLYLLMETITRSEYRLNLTKARKHQRVTSYIVKQDRNRLDVTFVNSYSDYTLKNGARVFDLVYPGKDRYTDLKRAFVEEDLSRIEKQLYSYDLTARLPDYTDTIDLESFAQYFVINEFFQNMDAGVYSTYFYRDARGKIKTCVWDFNNSCGNDMERDVPTGGFHMQFAPWFERLVRDRRFVDEVIRQYRTLRQGVLSDAYLQNYISETIDWLGDNVEKNYEVWDDAFDYDSQNWYIQRTNYLQPAERNHKTYEEAVTQLRTYIAERGQWLDDNIENLQQYCHTSKTANETLQ